MSVLLSIKPQYVDKISEGVKRYEFRRLIFKQTPNEIWVYASSPVKKIVGIIFVDEIIKDTPLNLWKNCKNEAGLNKQDFLLYFNGKKEGYAIKIKDYKPFKTPIDPYSHIPRFSPPQSFSYIDNFLNVATLKSYKLFKT